jgi:hypothetical protein
LDSASFDQNDTENDSYTDNEERNGGQSTQIRGEEIMFTSLCAAFTNLDPIVPPAVRRHSSRWRMFLLIVIGIMTFSASFAHLRYLMNRGTDRRVEERNRRRHALRSLRFFARRNNPVQPPPHLRTSTTEKETISTNPRVLLGATITSWTVWCILVATHPLLKRRTDVAVGEGCERAIITLLVFIISCLLTYWTRIRYTEIAAEALK